MTLCFLDLLPQYCRPARGTIPHGFSSAPFQLPHAAQLSYSSCRIKCHDAPHESRRSTHQWSLCQIARPSRYEWKGFCLPWTIYKWLVDAILNSLPLLWSSWSAPKYPLRFTLSGLKTMGREMSRPAAWNDHDPWVLLHCSSEHTSMPRMNAASSWGYVRAAALQPLLAKNILLGQQGEAKGQSKGRMKGKSDPKQPEKDKEDEQIAFCNINPWCKHLFQRGVSCLKLPTEPPRPIGSMLKAFWVVYAWRSPFLRLKRCTCICEALV